MIIVIIITIIIMVVVDLHSFRIDLTGARRMRE